LSKPTYKLGRGNQRKKAGRPRKPQKAVATSISMPPHVYEAISKLAEEKNKSFSAMIVEIISKQLNIKVKL